MGQSSSTEQDVSPELREVQSLAASTGALHYLEKAFSLLSDHETKSIPLRSLEKCFELSFGNLESDHDVVSKELPLFFSQLGSTIVDIYFVSDKNGVSWIEFLKGYTKCCARTVASTSFVNLFRVFATTCSKAGLPVSLQFEEYDDDCKISGMLSVKDVTMLLLICWIFAWDGRRMKSGSVNSKSEFGFPDISHLVASAIVSCSKDVEKLDFSDSVNTKLDVQLPAAGIHSWGLKTVPNLADCFVQFIHARVCYLATREDKSEIPTCSSAKMDLPSDTKLLTCGRAWAISLTQRDHVQEELLKICFPVDDLGNDDDEEGTDVLLYQSSVNGKGMNRFWSNVEGYKGPMLMIISACEEQNANRWIIGALTGQGFENKDVFYGTSGSLYALYPVFNPIPSFGREKNFVYSHLHPTGYEPHPKPVGIAFGGSAGNERIFMDEDFAKVTLRHHAVDKTYQHAPLFLNQGFLPVEASVFGVEVWGLGGKTASTKQSSYKKREELFTNQRRKIDLAKFSNWEDSPEKMMMDMMSNPNAPRREER